MGKLDGKNTAASTKLDISAFLGRAPGRGFITILGPSGAGKTIAAITASKDLVRDERGYAILPSPSPAVVTDILVLAYDMGALDGLPALGVSIDPSNVIDARGAFETHGSAEGIAGLTRMVKAHLEAHPSIRFVLHDTVSELDAFFVTEFEQTAPLSLVESDEGGRNPLWPLLSGAHRSYLMGMTGAGVVTGAQQIFNAHGRARFLPRKDEEKYKKQAEASRVSGMPDILVDITGKSREIYTRNASLVLAMKDHAVKTPQGVVHNRVFYSDIALSGGWEAKNRLDQRLPPKAPADLRAYLLAGGQKLE